MLLATVMVGHKFKDDIKMHLHCGPFCYPQSQWTLPLGIYLLRIAPVAARATANKTAKKKWTSFAGHFDGCGSAPVQYHAYCLMEEVKASIEATGHRQWASIVANSTKGTWLRQFFLCFSLSTH
jgi:hypothetical protein